MSAATTTSGAMARNCPPEAIDAAKQQVRTTKKRFAGSAKRFSLRLGQAISNNKMPCPTGQGISTN
jgi:hypothetical protein